MIFTIGDIIVLLVVVAVLIIYRQIDRNNRSLEKVRRYADKVVEDLNSFVESKIDDLKNLGIELDVHQKTAKEILKRISSIEDDVAKRTAGVEEIRERINQYDNVLHNLIDMTKTVDENLKRLHEESEFVDGVGKRVREAMSTMSQIEKSIPNLKQEFGRQNADQLKTLSTEIIRSTEEIVDSMTDEVTRSDAAVKEFSEYISQLEARRDDLEEETVNNLRNRFQEFVAEADDSKSRIMSNFEADIKRLLDQEEQEGRELVGEIKTRHESLKDEVEQSQELLNEKLEIFQDRAARIEDEFQATLKEAAEKGKILEDEVFTLLKDHIETRARTAETSLHSLLNETQDKMERSRKELVRMFGETRSEITVWRAELQKNMAEASDELQQKYETFAGDMAAKFANVNQRADGEKAEQKAALDRFIQETRSMISELESTAEQRTSELIASIENKEKQIGMRLEDVDQRGREMAESVRGNMEAKLIDFEGKLSERLGDFETKVTDYEEDATYRFERVEEINSELNSFENNMRKNMEKTAAGVRQDFELAISRISSEREQEKKKAEQQLVDIHASLETIDKELVDLKSRAYENVSEKLQVFEDDFFSDLRGRSEQMKERLESWQNEINSRMEDLVTEQRTERDRIEKSYGEDLKNKIADLQNGTLSQYERFNTQVGEFQNTLNDRISAAESFIESYKTTLSEEMANLKETSKRKFEIEFQEHTQNVEDQLKQRERELDMSLRVLGEEMERGRKEIRGGLDSTGTDVAIWQANVLQQMKEAKAGIDGEVQDLKGVVHVSIDTLKDEFRTQKDELVTGSEEERGRLRDELQSITAAVQRLDSELKNKSIEAVENVTKHAGEFLVGFQQKADDLESRSDERIKEFRTLVQEIRDRVETTQQKLQIKIEESYNILSVNIQEIDKQQKSFVTQTEIFERADSLKVSLQESIEVLKSDIARMEDQSSGLRDAEKNFTNIRKLGEEVSAKLTKFLTNKRKIESMDDDFKRLISISQTVDAKLEQVTSSHDKLQEMQAQIRNLDNLEKEVAQKYERLENRKQIIDTTIEGVDRNFQTLEDLEDEIKKTQGTLSPIPRELEEMEDKIRVLSSNKPKAEQTIQLVEQLDSNLKDLEERLEKIQTAREWLARTETRLEDINKQAEDQVKLLGTLMKEGAKKTKQERGAPASGERDTVVRLSHQGWTVAQIAQATGLSKGEVELILELGPKR